jgi:hypothetical protein
MARQVDDEWVADQLAECLVGRSGYPSPDENAVRHITRRINICLTTPWTDEGIANLREQAKFERREAAALKGAATILSRDLDGWRELLPRFEIGTDMRVAAKSRIEELEITIKTLQQPRGHLTQPGLTVKLSDKGPPPKPWALMAANIADEVHRVLHDGGDPRTGLGGPDGPVTNFLSVCLREILPAQDVPANSTINETVTAHLGRSLEYRLRGY